MANSSPILIRHLSLFIPSIHARTLTYKIFILCFTFLCYTSYHLSRKPISIVKSVLHNDSCDTINTTTIAPTTTQSTIFTTSTIKSHYAQNTTHHQSTHDLIGGSKENTCGYHPFDSKNGKELLASLDLAFLFAYAMGMFVSGHIAERMNLRYFLTIGMIGSGIFTALFGFGRYWNIHVLWYFIVIQIIAGLFQASGWPSVVTCVSNWFGKGRRGFIMGVWNSHTSVGNILGSVIAGLFVESNWGLSFIIPGIIIASMGVLVFILLVPEPADIGCEIPDQHNVSPINGSSEEEPLMHSSTNSENLDAELQLNQEANLSTTVINPHESNDHVHAIRFIDALRIPGVLEFATCLFFAKLVSYTFLYWLPEYIHNSTSYGSEKSADLSTIFDFGGIFGGIMAGIVSDALGARASVCGIMLFSAAPMMFFYQAFGNTSLTINIVMLLFVGALVNGPYALITTAVSADLGTHSSLQGNAKALSTVTAIIDGIGSIGAAIGPLLTGVIASHTNSWGDVFYMLIVADLLAFLLLGRLIYKEICRWISPYSTAER